MSRNVTAYREAAARFKFADDALTTKFRKMAIQLEGDGKFEQAYQALRFAVGLAYSQKELADFRRLQHPNSSNF